jgi:arylsulfatase A
MASGALGRPILKYYDAAGGHGSLGMKSTRPPGRVADRQREPEDDMNIRDGLHRMAVGMLAAVLLTVGGGRTSARAEPPPAAPANVVIFLIDDLGWMDLGCQGSRYYRTPHIDALARDGVRCTAAYAACAVCSPTRAALLTGKYPARILLTDWLPSGRWDPRSRLLSGRFVRGLPLEERSLAEVLREAGYRTGIVGKWHLGSEPFSLPEHHGFDVNVGGNAHGAPGSYFFPYEGDWAIPSTGRRARWQVFADGAEGEYLTERLTAEAVRFIDESADRPFFLYLPHYAVHTPLEAKPDRVTRYAAVPEAERQGDPVYAAMVESVDDSVGEVLAALERHGLTDRTLVIFTSDNGGFWKATDQAPLRGHKGCYYEGGIRVPLIIRWPGVTRPGLVVDEPVITPDLYPTVLDAAGLPPLPAQHRDGVDLRPLVDGSGGLPERPLFWHFPHYNEHPSSVPSSVIRQGSWKLIETFDPEGVELYDLATDLGETTNLAAEQPDRRDTLLAMLEAWRVRVGAERMEPNPDHDPGFAPRKKQKHRMRQEP